MAQFHDALESEDCDKELVDEVEDDSQLGRLVVVLHRHRRHIEQDLTPTHSLTHSLILLTWLLVHSDLSIAILSKISHIAKQSKRSF